MAKVENKFVCDLSKPVHAQALKGNVFSLDNLGSRLSVLIYENGQPATITGTVTASFILPDGSTVNVNGGLATENGGSKAYVDVPQSCLLIPGILKIAIKVTSSSVITTLAAIVANVYMTKTDNVITPSQQIITDWNAEISASLANQDAEISNLKSVITTEDGQKVNISFSASDLISSKAVAPNLDGTTASEKTYSTYKLLYLNPHVMDICGIKVPSSCETMILLETITSYNSGLFSYSMIGNTSDKAGYIPVPKNTNLIAMNFNNFSGESITIECVVATKNDVDKVMTATEPVSYSVKNIFANTAVTYAGNVISLSGYTTAIISEEKDYQGYFIPYSSNIDTIICASDYTSLTNKYTVIYSTRGSKNGYYVDGKYKYIIIVYSSSVSSVVLQAIHKQAVQTEVTEIHKKYIINDGRTETISYNTSALVPDKEVVPGTTSATEQSVSSSANYKLLMIDPTQKGIRGIKLPNLCESVVFLTSITGVSNETYTYEMVGSSTDHTYFVPVPSDTNIIALNFKNVSDETVSIDVIAENNSVSDKKWEVPEVVNFAIPNKFNNVAITYAGYSLSIQGYMSAIITENNKYQGYYIEASDTIDSVICASDYSGGHYVVDHALRGSKNGYYIENKYPHIIVVYNTTSETGEIKAIPRYSFYKKEQKFGELYNDVIDVVKSAVVETSTDIHVIFPDGNGTYQAFWTRDYAYALDGSLIVEPNSIKDAYNFIKSAMSTTGDRAYQVPDHVLLTGEPCWTAGTYEQTGGWGYYASMDGPGFLVDIANEYVKRTADTQFINDELPFLKLVVDNILTANNEVYVEEGKESVSYGFYDTVKLRGTYSFPTIQAYKAYKIFEEWAEMAGISLASKANAIRNRFNSSRFLKTITIERENGDYSINEQLMYVIPSNGLSVNQFDVWSTAYAIETGILFPGVETMCCNALYRYYEQYVKYGMVKHVPTSFYYATNQMWESYFVPNQTDGSYQNGGYWLTPMKWILKALKKVNREKADELLNNAIINAEKYNYPEYVTESGTRATPNYVSSATQLYQATLLS